MKTRPPFLVALFVTFALTVGVAVAGETQQRIGLGPLEGLPVFFNTTALSTTPVKATLATPAQGQGIGVRFKIVNGSANVVAWTLVVRDAAAPTITADYAATGASPVLAGGVEIVAIPVNRDLYIVASAPASSVSVTSFLYN